MKVCIACHVFAVLESFNCNTSENIKCEYESMCFFFFVQNESICVIISL